MCFVFLPMSNRFVTRKPYPRVWCLEVEAISGKHAQYPRFHFNAELFKIIKFNLPFRHTRVQNVFLIRGSNVQRSDLLFLVAFWFSTQVFHAREPRDCQY